MSERFLPPSAPQGDAVREAYAEITKFNGRKMHEATTRPNGVSSMAVDEGSEEMLAVEYIEALDAIGVKIQLDQSAHPASGEYKPVLQDVGLFVDYIGTLKTEDLDTDTTELRLIGAVLRGMITTVHICYSSNDSMDEEAAEYLDRIAEETLGAFELIDKVLVAKGLNPPPVYVAALDAEPELRLNDAWKMQQEASSYMNTYNELTDCIAARENQSLASHFEFDV